MASNVRIYGEISLIKLRTVQESWEHGQRNQRIKFYESMQ